MTGGSARRLLVPAAVAVVVTLTGLVMLLQDLSRPLPAPDLPALNHLQQQVSEQWPTPVLDRDATVTDVSGRVLASRGEPLADDLTAARVGAISLGIVRDGHQVGTVRVPDPARQALLQRQDDARRTAVACLLAGLAVAMGTLIWVWRRLLVPLDGLSGQARRIAAGALDVPLPLRRGSLLVTFTEAFDLMRETLRSSRQREVEVADSRRSLISQLGHDIRTPLATIKATNELARLRNSDLALDQKLAVTDAKTDQIAGLLDDLFMANRRADDLSVDCQPHSSDELLATLRQADARGVLGTVALPPALLHYDERRLVQVLDNVLSNAAKYAGTPVDLTARLDDERLLLALADRGAGVAEDELGRLTEKGVRGSNATGRPGSGLGLYTSAWLMERMGGSLAVGNRSDRPGFRVELAIPVAGSFVAHS